PHPAARQRLRHVGRAGRQQPAQAAVFDVRTQRGGVSDHYREHGRAGSPAAIRRRPPPQRTGAVYHDHPAAELFDATAAPPGVPAPRADVSVRLAALQVENDSAAGGADPAGLRDVDHDPVRPVVLDLDIAAVAPALADAERGVDVVPRPGPGRGQIFGDFLQAIDLKADVVNT